MHVCADAVACKALHNLMKTKEFSKRFEQQNKVNGTSTDPKSFFFSACCYDMPNYIEWNTGAASCKKVLLSSEPMQTCPH